MSKTPVHAPQTQYEVKDNQLMIGGLSVSQLVDRVGSTPFYAYDRAKLTERVNYVRQHMPEKLKIHYAMKANPMPALVQHMAAIVDGFDLASANEMQVALDTPMSPKHISMAGPGKRIEELSQAIAAGITINIESETELDRIVAIVEQKGYIANIAVRINPAFELKASGMKMSGGPKQFGIDEERLPALLQRIQSLPVTFQGFHIYSGSQNLKPESIIEAQQRSLLLADRLLTEANLDIIKLNIGGGYGIPYFPGETPLPLKEIGEKLAANMEKFHQRFPQADIIIELGRYLVGEAGVYVSKIIDKKYSREQAFLVVDGGLHHHLAATGNFGQVIRKNYPVAIANKMGEPSATENVNIVGPLCTPLDILAGKMDLPVAQTGDYITVFQSGAYGFTASPHLFLSQPECREVLV